MPGPQSAIDRRQPPPVVSNQTSIVVPGGANARAFDRRFSIACVRRSRDPRTGQALSSPRSATWAPAPRPRTSSPRSTASRASCSICTVEPRQLAGAGHQPIQALDVPLHHVEEVLALSG